MEEKKTYIKPEILIEEWKVYKVTMWRGKRVYEVSNFGRIKVNGIITEPHTRPGGYKRISSFMVHRAVAELFIPNPENKSEVDHIDTNPSNNMVWNLRWATRKENANNPLTRQHNSEAQKIAMNKPEVKQKRSESLKGRAVWNKGISPSKETRQKQSEVMKGKNKGKPCPIKGKHKVYNDPNDHTAGYHYE